MRSGLINAVFDFQWTIDSFNKVPDIPCIFLAFAFSLPTNLLASIAKLKTHIRPSMYACFKKLKVIKASGVLIPLITTKGFFLNSLKISFTTSNCLSSSPSVSNTKGSSLRKRSRMISSIPIATSGYNEIARWCIM